MAKQSAFRAVYERIRKKTGIPQQELAARIGLHPITLSRWKLGKTVPDAKHLRPMIAFFQSIDVKAAEDLAATVGQTLLSLDLVKIRPPKDVEATAILLAAAEAANVPPQKARAAILATLEKMQTLDVTAAELEALLAKGDRSRATAG